MTMTTAPMSGPSQWLRPPRTLITITNNGTVNPNTDWTATNPICRAKMLPPIPPISPFRPIAIIF